MPCDILWTLECPADLGDLPASAARLAQDYRGNAQQRVRVLVYEAQQAGQQQGPVPGPSSALGGLAKGQQEVLDLLEEFQGQGRRLRRETLQRLAEKYNNLFFHAHVEQQLVPALLLPTHGLREMEDRIALLQVGCCWAVDDARSAVILVLHFYCWMCTGGEGLIEGEPLRAGQGRAGQGVLSRGSIRRPSLVAPV
jgi:hypothetical protein